MAGPQGMEDGDGRSSPATGLKKKKKRKRKTMPLGMEGREKLQATEKEQKHVSSIWPDAKECPLFLFEM